MLLSTTSVPVWQKSQRYLPALFVSSAVASCASLFELLELSPRETAIAHRFGAVGKAAELVCMTAVESTCRRTASTAQPLHSGISGALWTASKVLTVASLAVSLMPGKQEGPELPESSALWRVSVFGSPCSMPGSALPAIRELPPAEVEMNNGIVNGLEKDLRASLRMFRRYPGITALALISLALGIGANTLAFSFVNVLLFRGLPYPDRSSW